MADFMQIRVEVARAEGAGIDHIAVATADLLAMIAAMDDLTAVVEKRKADAAERRQSRRGTPDDEKCAKWLFGLVWNRNNKAKEPTWTTWSDHVRQMRELDGRTHKEICALFKWASEDEFWCSNILSPKTLRAQWDRLAIKRDQANGIYKGEQPQLGKAGRATARAAEEWLKGANGE